MRGSAAPTKPLRRDHDRVGRGEWPADHDLVAARLQRRDEVRRQVLLDHDLIGQPLIMHARHRHGACDVHAAVDDIDDDLQHRRDDAAAAGRAGNEKRLAVLQDDRRRHRRQRPLAGSGFVGFEADQPIGVRRLRLGGEIVELVVEQDAGAVRHEPDAVAEVERVGVGDGIAEPIDDREVRGVAALGLGGAAGANPVRRRRMRRIDGGAPLRGVILGDQPRHRNLDGAPDRRGTRPDRRKRASSPRSAEKASAPRRHAPDRSLRRMLSISMRSTPPDDGGGIETMS